jgi:hypothetical protein
MKPRNKREAAVLEMANAMPALTAAHEDYLKARFERVLYYRMNGACKCSACGYEWQEMPSTARYWRNSLYNALGMAEDYCPECNVTLRPKYQRGRWREVQRISMQVMDECNGWQVLRHARMDRTVWDGQPTRYEMKEEYQTWLNDKGQEVIVTRPYTRSAFMLSIRYDEPFTIGRHNMSYTGSYYYDDMFDQRATYFYPRVRISATLRRNGWAKRFNQARAEYRYDIARKLLTDNRLETLAKSGESTGVVMHYARHADRLETWWPQLRIAIRNGYRIADVQMWEDMLGALQELGRDIHSPHYILPADLIKEHDRWTRKQQEKRTQEERRKAAQKDRKYYLTHKQFEALPEKQGRLLIRPLLTASELVLEGEAMHHCVGTYGNKLTSLILSVRDMKGYRLETVEVNLKLYRIEQSRAVNNGITERHDEILNAVTKLMPEIRRCNKAV